MQTASRITSENTLPVPERSDTLLPVDADEHIALCYAAGYVFHTLKARFKGKPALASWLSK